MSSSTKGGFFRTNTLNMIMRPSRGSTMGKNRRGTSVANNWKGRLQNELTNSDLTPTGGVSLLILNPQIDFHKDGKMPIPYADRVSQKIAQLISSYGDAIDEIYVSIQQRPSYHVGHPSFWQDKSGKVPEGFIHIDQNDINKGNFLTRNPEHREWGKEYFTELNKKDLRNIVVFPEHCLAASKGAAVVNCIATALRTWETSRMKSVKYIVTGSSSKTEQFSIFQPLVRVKDDPTTEFNRSLWNSLTQHSRIVICGHMLSHGIKYTIKDFIANSSPKMDTSLIVLQDLCSSLRDFRNGCKHFIEKLKCQFLEEDLVITSSSDKAALIFDQLLRSGGDLLRSEVTLFAQSQGKSFFQKTFSSLVYSEIGNDEFFNFEHNGTALLGDGCYLIYDPQHNGTLVAVWYRAQEHVSEEDLESLRSCLGFFKPGFNAVIGDYKFRHTPDNVKVLVKNIHKGHDNSRTMLFEGILKFIEECRKYEGSFILKATDDGEEGLIDAGLYGLDFNNNIISIDAEHFVDPANLTTVSCIPKSVNAYRGVTKQKKDVFVKTGKKLGATMDLVE